MKALLVLAICVLLSDAQQRNALYYQRQKEHREGTAHRNDGQNPQYRGNQQYQQGGRGQYQSGPVYNDRQQQYGYRNIQGAGVMGFSQYDNTPTHRAMLSIQLLSYTNKDRFLPNYKQCFDGQPSPPSEDGTAPANAATSNSDRDCMFTFATIIDVPRHHMKVIQTQEYSQLTAANGGSVDLTQRAPWNQLQQFPLGEKPTSINVVVMHSGNQRYRNGSWPYNSGLRYSVLVDVFSQNTTGDNPGVSTGTGGSIDLTGTELQTTLKLSYSISCMNIPGENVPYQGVNCDLRCNDTANNKDGFTYCVSDVTHEEYQCVGKSQNLGDCTYCNAGFADGKCYVSGEPRVATTYIGVSTGWRTVGIIFIILTVILAVILLLFICFFWWSRRKDEKKTEWSQWPYSPPGRNEPESPNRPAPPLPAKASTNGTTASARNESEQNPDWYQPQIVSLNQQQRSAPDTGSRHSSQLPDDRGSESSYGVRNGRMTPRREAAV